MKKILVLCFILFSMFLYAEEKVYIDNDNVHEYRGFAGKWVYVNSMYELKKDIKKYDSSISRVKELNENLLVFDTYLFIPYSKKYYNSLSKNNRKVVLSKEGDFVWPLVDFERISSGFGRRWGQLHAGFDLPAKKGTPVVAAMDGRIVQATVAGGHGKTIYIEHRDNFYTRYSHNSVLLVKKNDYVRKGQIIAKVGTTGNSTGNHLHFEIRYKEIPLNPLDFMPVKKNLKK